MGDLKAHIGRRLKELRDRRGLTQEEVAQGANVCTRAYIGKLESGEREPTAGVLKGLADFFGVSVESFYEETYKIPLAAFVEFFPEDVREFLLSFDGLPYLISAKKAKDYELSPENLQELIEVARRMRNMSK